MRRAGAARRAAAIPHRGPPHRRAWIPAWLWAGEARLASLARRASGARHAVKHPRLGLDDLGREVAVRDDRGPDRAPDRRAPVVGERGQPLLVGDPRPLEEELAEANLLWYSGADGGHDDGAAAIRVPY